jgi:hypothetical protein
MKRWILLLVAYLAFHAFLSCVLLGCATVPHGDAAKYDTLMSQHDQMADELQECAIEPGCIDSARYYYTLDAMAQLSIQASVANPYKGY